MTNLEAMKKYINSLNAEEFVQYMEQIRNQVISLCNNIHPCPFDNGENIECFDCKVRWLKLEENE